MKKYLLRSAARKFLIQGISEFTQSLKTSNNWSTENRKLCFLGAEHYEQELNPATPFGLFYIYTQKKTHNCSQMKGQNLADLGLKNRVKSER